MFGSGTRVCLRHMVCYYKVDARLQWLCWLLWVGGNIYGQLFICSSACELSLNGDRYWFGVDILFETMDWQVFVVLLSNALNPLSLFGCGSPLKCQIIIMMTGYCITEIVSQCINSQIYPEPVNRWRNMPGGHNALALLYENNRHWSLTLQSYVQLTMLENHISNEVWIWWTTSFTPQSLLVTCCAGLTLTLC